VLTYHLAQLAGTIAVDIDERSREALSITAPAAHFVCEDVLKFNLRETLLQLERPRVVVSNLPYYISTAVLTRLSDVAGEFERAVLMMQEEVAERVAAPPGDRRRGALSTIAQWHFDISTVCKVAPGAFRPPPKVSSSVLLLILRNASSPPFQRLAAAGFTQPRKTLLNNLSAIFSRDDIERALADLQISLSVRPHQLTEDEWIRLASRVSSPKN
jgi:16S rRNA (adenine1518-N6/adenine1519-N6)-dimethyltransferase